MATDTLSHLHIVHVGMITPLGSDYATSAAAVRAGMARFDQSSYTNDAFMPMKMAQVPGEALPPLQDALNNLGLTLRQKRLLRLLTPALSEALVTLPAEVSLPLFIGAAEAIPGCAAPLPARFLHLIKEQTKANIDTSLSRVFATGRVSGLQALEMAYRYFEATGQHLALVGAVDSYQDSLLLSKLSKERRILAVGMSDGFVPSEAACCLLVATEQGMRQLNVRSLGYVSRPGFANEPGHHYSEAPYKGEGLDASWKQVLTNRQGHPVNTLFSSMNGEHFWAKELGVSVSRNSQQLDPEMAHVHPADCLGDIGAATAPVLIALALKGMQQKYYRPPGLVSCASDTGPRAAVQLQV